MTLRRWWRRSLYHFHYGRHSNIPTCCILFFILWWQPRSRWKINRFYWRIMDWREKQLKVTGSDYVQCPLCILIGRYHKLHHCQHCVGVWDQYREAL